MGSMKTALSLTVLLLGLAVAAQAAGKAEVMWNPDAYAYRDIEMYGMEPDDSLEVVQDGMNEVFERLANSHLAAGQTLQVTVNDLDLAGQMEPYRGGAMDDVRIVRSIYPPAIKFDWKVVNAAGETVLEGTEDIVDMGFEMRLTRSTSRRMFEIEEQMLRHWASTALKPAR